MCLQERGHFQSNKKTQRKSENRFIVFEAHLQTQLVNRPTNISVRSQHHGTPPHPHSGRCFSSAAAAESEVSPNPHLSPHILPSTCLHSIRKSSPYEIGNRNGSAVSVAGSIPHALSCTQPEIVSLILFLDYVVLVRLQYVKLVHPRY